MSIDLTAGMTGALYLRNPLLLEMQARVIKKGQSLIRNKNYHWITLDQTIFHPQGGGQPSDQGTINGISVDFVNKLILGKVDEFEIQHCFLNAVPFEIGEQVTLSVDADTRILHMRMHTAGHLIAYLVEKEFKNLKAIGGNHFPNDGYVKFKIENSDFNEDLALQSYPAAAIEKVKAEGATAKIVYENGTRKLKIAGSEGVPCGGTHMTDLCNMGNVKIDLPKINKKECHVTIKYGIGHS